jgi:hypothetical protein
MEQLQTFSTMRGRMLLRDIVRELRYEKQVSSITTLLTCWRLCTFEREVYRYSKRQVTVIHALGLFRGTSLWLQEVINRFYFSTINSLVYLGAAILLVIVSANRFTDKVDNRFVIGGVLLEAFMLLILFVVMFFSPSDDTDVEEASSEGVETSTNAELREIAIEIGEISTDYATSIQHLDNVATALTEIIARQNDLLVSVSDIAQSVALASSPQPEFVETMRKTNISLEQFHSTVQTLVGATETLRREEIQRAVRLEVERILHNRMEA